MTTYADLIRQKGEKEVKKEASKPAPKKEVKK